ncbi:MAG: hypothetical protein IT581_23005 [Verrucomicrobiales bacterium]|nr:hypothetical protein [Verrucomicrobiales bacterium]
MPKDEFDFEDPLELNGMAFLSQEDTTDDMAECFTEEFLRIGFDHHRVLALFANPHYLGPHLAYQQRGEAFIRDLIAGVFARWGRPVRWPNPTTASPPIQPAPVLETPSPTTPLVSASPDGRHGLLTDPTGAPLPQFEI